MPIGPSLPPHLTKRTRDEDDDRSTSPESSEKRRRVLGPALPPAQSSPPRPVGPSLPPQLRSRSSSGSRDVGPSPPPASKPARVLGPAPPPAPLDERPHHPPSDDSDSSDDDFGPAPPPTGASYNTHDDEDKSGSTGSAFDTDPQYNEEDKKVQRDSWMTMPPTQDDLARMDPTKMRARKFNTGKSAGSGTGGGMDIWTETPEQKLKRLQDEAMGISAHSNSSSSKKESRRAKEEEEKARKLREKIDGARGKSLVEQHQAKAGKEKEDDPSKRVFDYEKDMALGTKVSHKQKRELLNKAKGFGDRFSSGSYL
ncbi:hypothetical protein N0V90_012691 [Kalmusia sp. IMI 367209]|nr:hypothetical protein N0V90_012691 [Kalmusia sp. IMI 367209]